MGKVGIAGVLREDRVDAVGSGVHNGVLDSSVPVVMFDRGDVRHGGPPVDVGVPPFQKHLCCHDHRFRVPLLCELRVEQCAVLLLGLVDVRDVLTVRVHRVQVQFSPLGAKAAVLRIGVMGCGVEGAVQMRVAHPDVLDVVGVDHDLVVPIVGEDDDPVLLGGQEVQAGPRPVAHLSCEVVLCHAGAVVEPDGDPEASRGDVVDVRALSLRCFVHVPVYSVLILEQTIIILKF